MTATTPHDDASGWPDVKDIAKIDIKAELRAAWDRLEEDSIYRPERNTLTIGHHVLPPTSEKN